MGERALAIVCDGDSVDYYRSQWGGSDQLLEKVFASDSPATLLDSVTWESIREPNRIRQLKQDACLVTEAIYLVTEDGLDVVSPLWFGIPFSDDGSAPGAGIFVPVESFPTFRSCRDTLQQFKELVLEFVYTHCLSEDQAETLVSRCFRLVCAVCPWTYGSCAS